MFRVRLIWKGGAWLLGLALLAPRPGVAADGQDGRAIYRNLCVGCHGKNGEGVKKKYADALHGDWSIEKLTRYIDKNMPDDAPEKCVGADAVAVAHYIYDAFYSREARARNHPARIDLARLTNRQYVNTVADLLKSFGGADAAPAETRGLSGNYRPNNRRGGGDRGGGERTSFNRTDRQISFIFDTNNPDAVKLGTIDAKSTNAFNITWRGAALAEESGDYEFIVKTPNGTRLWVNDEETPLIEASVASGAMDEHKAVIRLLGGRAYPLRLELSKAAKDKKASIELLWTPPHGAMELIPARQLSPARVSPTYVVTTPFPADDSSVGYERGVSVSKAWDEAATQAAIEVANHVARNLDRLAGTKVGATNRSAKAEKFLGEFVAAAFRRPLTAEQHKMFVASQFKKTIKIEDSAKRVVLLALKSPRFLYLGLDAGKPDDFEVATRLSFGLWDSMPDKDLLALAAKNELHTHDQVTRQAARMLGDARARSKMRAFLHHWLQMDHLDNLSKDDKLFPGFTPDIIADLRTSLNLFLDEVVWNKESDYRRLLLEDDLFVNDRLAKFYGVSTNCEGDFVKVSLDPKERSGVLTHPYLLAAFSYQKTTSPIHRGVFLTRNIVGRSLKPPPMAQTFKDADFAPNLTMREKITELTRPQACQGCHTVINPLGFSLEHYDAVGRFRTQDGNKPVDAVSDYTTDDGKTVRLTGARDVAEFAVGSEHAQNAFIEQLFHQVVKQPMLAYGLNTPDRLRQSFISSGYNVQKLLEEIVTTSALHSIEKAKK